MCKAKAMQFREEEQSARREMKQATQALQEKLEDPEA
jgi:hypothetical protein